MIRCLCIDDKNRPKEIPPERWPKEEHEYHITFIAFCFPQKVKGVSLHELTLDHTNAPYEYYKGSRFAIHADDWEAFIELVKDCTALDDLDAAALVEKCGIGQLEKA